MSIATMNTATSLQPGVQLAPAKIEQFAPADGGSTNRDSLSENFNREIDAWARHALGANGFGDCP